MVLRDFGYEDVSMEYFFAEERRPIADGLADLAACDLYIAIIGWRYGYVPRHNNLGRRSITELEYELAEELGKPRLMFLVDPKATTWKASLSDKDRRKITAFRTRVINAHLVQYFTSPASLRSALTTSLVNLDRTSPHSTAVPPSPQTAALIRSLTDSPERIARLLASIVLADRSRLALLESPNTAGIADALSSHNAQNAEGVATFIGRMDNEPFEPDPLWLAWITNIHRERLTEIGTEILRVSGLGGLE